MEYMILFSVLYRWRTRKSVKLHNKSYTTSKWHGQTEPSLYDPRAIYHYEKLPSLKKKQPKPTKLSIYTQTAYGNRPVTAGYRCNFILFVKCSHKEDNDNLTHSIFSIFIWLHWSLVVTQRPLSSCCACAQLSHSMWNLNSPTRN